MDRHLNTLGISPNWRREIKFNIILRYGLIYIQGVLNDCNSKILLTPMQLESETISKIKEYYNLNRRHLSNDYLSPINYESRALKNSTVIKNVA